MRCRLPSVPAVLLSLTVVATTSLAGDLKTPESSPILQDDFERTESDPSKEQIGGQWGTNSKSRAKGNKQVSLVDGAMHIVRHPVADHGVSVVHDLEFTDATIAMRFKIGPQDDLGINIADMKEKSVHAGHLCMARIRTGVVELTDLKTGRMNLKNREAKLSNSLSEQQKKQIAHKTKRSKNKIQPNQWHDLVMQIDGDTMRIAIDGEEVGQFQSAGIAHPTKRRMRLAVNKSAWVDDVRVWNKVSQ